jgi:peptidyl-prolyl cis-trans isomerase B (cyclophilin B)
MRIAIAVGFIALTGAPALADTTAGAGDPIANHTIALEDATKGVKGTGALMAKIDVEQSGKALGSFSCELFDKQAPKTVANFVGLARGLRPWLDTKTNKWVKKPFYDGLIFHRVIPGFMIQGGDPNTKKPEDPMHQYGTGGQVVNGHEVRLKAEFNDTSHRRGIVSMARSQEPDSASSQFFIVVKDSTFLDGKYSAFGEVVSGIDIADKIAGVPRNAQDRPNQPVRIKKVVLTLAKG